MGAFEVLEAKVDALLELAREERVEQQEARKKAARKKSKTWKQVTDLAKIWSLDPRSVDALVKAGTLAGVVETCVFSVRKGGKVLERVELGSFEEWMKKGGAA